MEQVRLASRALQGNPRTLNPALLPGAEKVNPLQRAWRTLLLGPVLLKYDDPQAFAALKEHQETFNFELGQTYGWQLDLRYEYAMITRPSGTGLGPISLLNLNGAADQAALLCGEVIRRKVGSGEWHYPLAEGCMVVPESEIAEIFRQVREEFGSRWGNTARKTSFQELLQNVYATLQQAGLLRGPDRQDNVLILPTIARFNTSYPPEEETSPLQPGRPPQQLSFDGPAPAREPERPARGSVPGNLAAGPGYNTVQAGRMLGVSDQSILNWLNTGFLKGERLKRGWSIPATEIERLQAIRRDTKTPTLTQPAGKIIPPLKEARPKPAPITTTVNPEYKGEQGYNSYEAARLLGVTDVTILSWLKKGKIQGQKIGPNWSIPPAEIERLRKARS
jgi:excisionase family DNA binding protein